MIARLRSFIKEGTPQFEPLGVDAVVRDALALGRTSLKISGVDVQTQIAAGLPRVRGDAVQLLQVMLNLVVNGCEARSERPVGDRRLRLGVAGRNGADEVEVVIADNGVGLPSGAEDRVFEPFTTKDKGLGLGLSIGRSIVTGHGGRLWGENNPEGGATFHVVLPAEGASSGYGSIQAN